MYQGVIYVTSHNATMAVDAKTGKQIWKSKIEYPAETPRIVCCGIINRGAALYDGKLFRTTLDANVIATRRQGRQGAVAAEGGRHQGRLFDDGGAAGRRRRRHHRHLRRRVRHPRLHRRLGSGNRQASLAHPLDPLAGRARRRHLEGRHLEARRRLDLDHRLLRSRAEHGLLGHRQSRPVQRGRAPRRQSLHLLRAGDGSQDRQDQVALPVLAEQSVRL